MTTKNNSLFRSLEKAFIDRLCRIVPDFMGTKTLTFLSLFSSAMILASYCLAGTRHAFLFAASFFILLQWVFDCLDGAIGRMRKEGYFRWGFYMDHLFDYFFMASIVFGYRALFPQLRDQLFLLFFLFSAIMVNFFLLYGTIRDREPDFVISFGKFSPIEFRLLIIALNTALYFYEPGVRHAMVSYFGYANIAALAALVMVVFSVQKKLSRYDIAENGRSRDR